MRRVPAENPRDGRAGDVEIIARPDDSRQPGAARGYAGQRTPGSAYASDGAVTPSGVSTPAQHIVECLQQLGLAAPLLDDLAASYTRFTSAAERRAALGIVLQGAGITSTDLIARSNQRLVAALIGPSGVGKTTTIAKLAAIAARVRRQRVALITVDTYRAGAINQLQTFANVLQLPMYPAYSREELAQALHATRDADVVLIDTPGCNPYNGEMLKELRDLLGARDPITCYLTLAMTADFGDLLQIGQRFSLLNPTGMVVTKIDETLRSPAMIGLAQRLQLPIHYISTGSQVPDEISLATPDLLADLLIYATELWGRRRP